MGRRQHDHDWLTAYHLDAGQICCAEILACPREKVDQHRLPAPPGARTVRPDETHSVGMLSRLSGPALRNPLGRR